MRPHVLIAALLFACGETKTEPSDRDGDGCYDLVDAAPDVFSRDRDGDGRGADCDPCLGDETRGDLDGDGLCPPLDDDKDGDGCTNAEDSVVSLQIIDLDLDGIHDDCDPCVGSANDGDFDGDGICDGDDPDRDGSGCLDRYDAYLGLFAPSCLDLNDNGCPDRLDLGIDRDGDGVDDGCDTDDDGDGCPDALDSAADVANGPCSSPVADVDGDGCHNLFDIAPLQASGDADGDGTPDHCDHDLVMVARPPQVITGVLETPEGDHVLGTHTEVVVERLFGERVVTGVVTLEASEVVEQGRGCDLNGDGWDEVATREAMVDLRSGEVVLDFEALPRDDLARVQCVDIEQDGSMELVGRYGTDTVAFWSSEGLLTSTEPMELPEVVLGQLDTDPALEWFRGAEVVDLVTMEVQGNGVPAAEGVLLYDVDRDGIDDVLYRRVGLWIYRTEGWVVSSQADEAVFEDVDGDGEVELLLFESGRRLVVDVSDGALMASVEEPCATPAVVDWGGRGIVCGGGVHRWIDPDTGESRALVGQGAASRPTVLDLDDDGVDEVVWWSEHSPDRVVDRVVVRELDGAWREMIPTSQAPGFVDLDANGELEMVLNRAAYGLGAMPVPLPLPVSARVIGQEEFGSADGLLYLATPTLFGWSASRVRLSDGAVETFGTSSSLPHMVAFTSDSALEWVGSTFGTPGIFKLGGRRVSTFSSSQQVAVDPLREGAAVISTQLVEVFDGREVLRPRRLSLPFLVVGDGWYEQGQVWYPDEVEGFDGPQLRLVGRTSVATIPIALRAESGVGSRAGEVVWTSDEGALTRYRIPAP